MEGRVEINLVTERLGEGQPEWVRVEVSDNGSGVPEDLRREIFKPFVSTKGSKGTGLGLPVSRKIAQEHGGDLILLPNEPNGCRFVLKLPSRILGEKTERAPEAHSPTILQSTSPLADNLPREG